MISEMFFQALVFATKAHDGQWRKGGGSQGAPPYVTHCIEVAEMLAVEGQIGTDTVLAIALLHDTIEDTSVTYKDLQVAFGTYVADGVQSLTIPPQIEDQRNASDYVERKHAFQMNALREMDRFCKLVKYADKTCNVRDLVRHPPNWKRESIKGYAIHAHELCSAVQALTEVPTGMLDKHAEVMDMFRAMYV